MLLISSTLAPSFGGLGVFARNPISKGSLVWVLEPRFDRVIPRDEFDDLCAASPQAAVFLETYAYLDIHTGDYVLCSDNARFINHSDNPNIRPVPHGGYPYGGDVADRDIQPGEEILISYDSICGKGKGF